MATVAMSESGNTDETGNQYTAGALEAAIIEIESKRFPAPPRIEVKRLSEYAADIIAQSAIPELDFGFQSLNRVAPIQMRSMGTLIGPTGAGKTALAMTLGAHRTHYVDHPSATQGPTIYFLFELTPPQLAARRAAQLSRFSWRQVLGGVMAQHEIEQTLAGEHFYVIKPPRNVDFLEFAPRVLDEVAKKSPGTPLLIADYLQRIKGKGRDVRESTSYVVDGIVDLVESRDMYGLVLSKGSRTGSRSMRDGKTKGEALVDTAAETSAIEAGSSAVLVLTYENRDGSESTDVAIQVAKGRFGAPGAALGFRFHGASGRWEELDEVPLKKADVDAEAVIMAILDRTPEGFTSRSDLQVAAGVNRQQGLATIKRLLVPNGPIEMRDGRLHRRKA
jgi:hypothetical protein